MFIRKALFYTYMNHAVSGFYTCFYKLVERFKSSFQISKSNWVFEKDVASKYSLRLPQLEYTRFPRAANEPPRATICGVSSRPFLPLESRVFQLLGWVYILNELL